MLKINSPLLEYNNRIFGLDLMRALAIIMVLVSHGRVFMPDDWNSPYLSLGGFLGVELFFVLSGFLVGGILIKTVHKLDNAFSLRDIFSFWSRRWFRTLPNYYLILIVNLVVTSIISDKLELGLSYFFFLQNFVTPILHGINYNQSWSLTVEEWFYIFLPILFLITFQIFGRRFRKKDILTAIVLTLVFYPLVKYGYILAIDWLGKGSKLSFNVFRTIAIVRLDSIMYGVLFAFLNFYYKDRLHAKRFILLFFSILLLTSCLIFFYRFDLGSEQRASDYINIFFPSVLSLGLSFLLPFFNSMVISKPNFVTHVILLTSLISYSLYLVHYSLAIPIAEALSDQPLIQLTIFWLVSFTISIIIYLFYERKMTSLRDHIGFTKIGDRIKKIVS